MCSAMGSCEWLNGRTARLVRHCYDVTRGVGSIFGRVPPCVSALGQHGLRPGNGPPFVPRAISRSRSSIETWSPVGAKRSKLIQF